VTQRELAARLGLSYATVSRAFNDDPRVTGPTRRRILREAERLGFRGNTLARALRLGRTFAIGVIYPNTSDSYWSTVLTGMEQRAREDGFHVIICHRQASLPSTEEIRFLLERRVDALVVQPYNQDEDSRFLAEVAAGPTPLIILDNRLPGVRSHFVGTDSRTGGRLACEYLLGLGHRRIAYAAGPAGNHAAAGRLQGYHDALAACPDHPEPCVVPAGWDRSDGEAAGDSVLALGTPPTAVMAVNDRCALGIWLSLRRAGLRIPQDISLVGHSGDPLGEYLETPLTTVRQPAAELGRRAVEIALAAIETAGLPLHAEEIPEELVIRDSCAPPRAR